MAIDWFNLGLGAADLWQRWDAFEDFTDENIEGYDEARDVLGTTHEQNRADVNRSIDAGLGHIRHKYLPFYQQGLRGMEGVRGMGEFDYTHGDYLRSDAYNFLLDEQLRGVQRGNAAQRMLRSTNTLEGMRDRSLQYAAGEYDKDYTRQHDAYKTNLGRYEKMSQLGLDAADRWGTLGADLHAKRGTTLAELGTDYGTNMGSIAIAEGGVRGQMALAKAEVLSEFLKGIGKMADMDDDDGLISFINDAINGIGDYVIDAAGNLVTKAGEVIMKGVDDLVDFVMGDGTDAAPTDAPTPTDAPEPTDVPTTDTLGGAGGTNVDQVANTAMDFAGDTAIEVGGDIANVAGMTENALPLAVDASGLVGLGGTPSALGPGGLFGTSSGIGADAIGAGSVGADALGINTANFANFGGEFAGAVESVGGTAAEAGTIQAASPWLSVGILAAPLVIGGLLYAMKDHRRYTDRAEDELQKTGDPVGGATGMYLNAVAENGDSLFDENGYVVGNISNARGVMMDTLNNVNSATSPQNEYYGNFVMQGIADILNDTFMGQEYERPTGFEAIFNTLSVTKPNYGEDFLDDTGKALRAIYGSTPVTERLNDLIEQYGIRMRYKGSRISEANTDSATDISRTESRNRAIEATREWISSGQQEEAKAEIISLMRQVQAYRPSWTHSVDVGSINTDNSILWGRG